MASFDNPASLDNGDDGSMSDNLNGDESPSPEELKSAQAAIAALQTATKNYPLYPQNHAISIKLISSTLDTLNYHFNFTSILKIDITKDGFSYRDQPLIVPGLQSDLLGPPLRRDGIEWIGFEKGLLSHEISYFVEIVNTFRNLADEPEGDLVTCLWKENLPHIKYHATEVLLETVPQFDFSQFKPRAEVRQKKLSIGKGARGGSSATSPTQQESSTMGEINLDEQNPDLNSLALSEEEKKILQQMVITEENWDNSYDIIDVLLILLEDQEEKDDFEAILDVIHTEFKDSLTRGEFQHSRLLLQRLREGVERFKYSDAPLRISSFYGELSSPDTLEELTESLVDETTAKHDTIADLKNTLAMLPPPAVEVLGPLLVNIPVVAFQRAIMEVIVFLSSQDFSVIERTVTDADNAVVSKLIPCLGMIQSSRALALLRLLTQNKPLKIRINALKVLLRRDGENIAHIFELIEDPQQEIRHLLFAHLSKQRNKIFEKLLLEYLRDREYTLKNSKHIEQCYKALGMCGSSLCLPYLRQELIEKPFIDIMTWKGSTHRRGAALALHLVDLPKAYTLLESATKSLFPNIRNAARSVSSTEGQVQ